jgi:hypothetical protein
MIKKILAAAAFGVFAMGAQASTNLVANGSFESSASASGEYCYSVNCTVPDWNASLLIASYSGAWGNPNGANPSAIPLGTWVAGLQNNGTLTSDVTIVAGQSYTLTWDDAGRSGYYNHAYDVTIGGVTFADLTTAGGQAWAAHSETFTALTSGSLTFTGQFITPDGTTFIDNVTLSAVPEPTSLLMMGVAALGLVGWRRRAQV